MVEGLEPSLGFHAVTRAWFEATHGRPTDAQRRAWPSILAGESTLLLAPTGSGKTLAAFLAALDRASFAPEPPRESRCRVLYVSPLKALAFDVDRNLRVPLAGLRDLASQRGVPFRDLRIGVRTSDTPAAERARFVRHPPDVLITTPESLFLLLTSAAREALRNVETVIIDEIHSILPTKRGAHLFLSLERLEAIRVSEKPMQRIGLSATQRPVDEVARLLVGADIDAREHARTRPVVVVDASAPRPLELRIEVPVEDLASPGPEGGFALGEPRDRSIWPSMHPRLVELVRAHRTTMIFVNSRRLAERLAAALDEAAGEPIARAHHGSVAREQRMLIEQALKDGKLRCIVATSTLELGLDLGSVDLVVQIEAPPSVAAGLQRIGRAGHSVHGTSKGIIFPKHRGDLLAASAAAGRMLRADIEVTAYPRSPLDVLAQQIVGCVAMDPMHVDALFAVVRRSANFTELARGSFDAVLDMLSGRYPSDDFAELRPRLNWDRTTGLLRARPDAKRLAVVNAGTIPDRGLYGVYVDAGQGGKTRIRVGELDEEMVFESRVGEVFVLGASSWRIVEITHDEVKVVPAPGEPGKMPFWRSDRMGRSLELGVGIGTLAGEIARRSEDETTAMLVRDHALDARAARNLVRYVHEQRDATSEVPSERTIVVERFHDELGDLRVCILSPFGGRVHAPLATTLVEKARSELGLDPDVVFSDDGLILRFPASDALPDVSLLLPSADEVEDLLVRTLGGTALFAATFRECAGRALLLPKRRPGKRTPLWAQRRRASDLLSVAASYGSFPIVLEAYRECLRDVFDLPGTVATLRAIEDGRIRIHTVDTRAPSPFAASLLFNFVANFLYEGDAPLAERRAQALALDHTRLRELLGEVELRDLLDPAAIAEIERRLAGLSTGRVLRDADELHDLLRTLGDLTVEEIALRMEGDEARVTTLLHRLMEERRAMGLRIAGQRRWAAVEDAARLRDGLGVEIPGFVPAAFLEPVANPVRDLVARHARTHGPFRIESVADRLGVDVARLRSATDTLLSEGRLVEGELSPGGVGRELCDAEVLRQIKRRSLSRLRAEVEPVTTDAYARFLLEWQGIGMRRRGEDALVAVLEQLQGVPLPASDLESEILPARLAGYRTSDLDALTATGEVVIRGIEPIASSTGRIALFFADSYALLAPSVGTELGELALRVRDVLARRGALFFHDVVREVGGFPYDILHALHELFFAGQITNDTLGFLRSLAAGEVARTRPGRLRPARRASPIGSEGRWSLLPEPRVGHSVTECRSALAQQLLERRGIVARDGVIAEGIEGGFGPVAEVYRAMEEAGHLRRGYFIEGFGGMQFARKGLEERLRALREEPSEHRHVVLAATDPANPYGGVLRWPESTSSARPQRAAGARVILVDGRLAAFVARTESSVLTFLPEDASRRETMLRAIASALAERVNAGERQTMLVVSVDGQSVAQSELASHLRAAGFVEGAKGFLRKKSLTERS